MMQMTARNSPISGNANPNFGKCELWEMRIHGILVNSQAHQVRAVHRAVIFVPIGVQKLGNANPPDRCVRADEAVVLSLSVS